MAAQKPPALEDVILALQKAISRVSTSTRSHLDSSDAPTAGVAMIEGSVAWEISLRTNLDGDRLVLEDQGAIPLKLTGVMTIPMSYAEDGDQNPAGQG